MSETRAYQQKIELLLENSTEWVVTDEATQAPENSPLPGSSPYGSFQGPPSYCTICAGPTCFATCPFAAKVVATYHPLKRMLLAPPKPVAFKKAPRALLPALPPRGPIVRANLASHKRWLNRPSSRTHRHGGLVRESPPPYHSVVCLPPLSTEERTANRIFLFAALFKMRAPVARGPASKSSHHRRAFARITAAIVELGKTLPPLATSANSRQELADYESANSKIISLVRVLAAQAKAHNRLMHSLNGNIAFEESFIESDKSREQVVAGEFSTSARPELGGAMPVLTEYLFGATIPSEIRVGGPQTFDKIMLQRPISLGNPTDAATAAEAGILKGRDKYHLQYPIGSGRLPEERFDYSQHIFLRNSLRSHNADFAAIPTPVAPERRDCLTVGADYLRDASADLRTLWDTSADVDLFSRADKALSSHRFAGTRGNRSVLGWEMQASNRISYFRNLAAIDAQGRSFYRMMYFLFSDYMIASIDESLANHHCGNLRQQNPVVAADIVYNAGAHCSPSSVRLHPIGARIPPAGQAAPPASPEDYLSNATDGPDHMAAIAAGTSVLLDVEGLDDRSIQIAIKAFAPRDRRFAWDYSSARAAPLDPIRLTSPLSLRDEAQADEGGAKDIVIHFGQAVLPTQDACELRFLGRDPLGIHIPANSPWSTRPNRSQIGSVIRHFIQKHHANNDAWAALDAVLYDTVAFEPSRSPVAAANAPIVGHLNCFGNDATASRPLPPDLTMPTYFDRFRSQMTLELNSPDVLTFLRAVPTEVVWTAAFMTHAASVAVNWAAYAFSMRQQEWAVVANPNAPGISQYRRNLSIQMTSRLLDTEISPWSTSVMASVALMYEFKPMPTTILYTTQEVAPVFRDNAAPYLGNAYHCMWMLKKIPQHMVLPWAGLVPTWPDGPKPMYSGDATPTPRVRLARALRLFIGRAWAQDGGMQANAQFYAATPSARHAWRSDIGGLVADPPVRLGSWNSPFQYEWPNAANVFDPVWLAPAGNPFASFVVPGTLQNYDSGANRIRACGAMVSQANEYTSDAFARLTLAEEQANVAIHYIPPVHFRVEYPPVNDFSMLVWTSTESQSYSGMTIHTGVDVSTLSPPSAGPSNPFPAEFANHNNPHAPGSGGSLAGYPKTPATRASKPKYTPPGPVMRAVKRQKTNAARVNTAPAEAGFTPKNPTDLAAAVERIAALTSSIPDPSAPTPRASLTRRAGSKDHRRNLSKLTRRQAASTAASSLPEVEALKEAFLADPSDDDAFQRYHAARKANAAEIEETLASLDLPFEAEQPPAHLNVIPNSSASKADIEFFRGVSRSDKPRETPLKNTNPPNLRVNPPGINLAPVPVDENNDASAPLTQQALIPPAPPITAEGFGNNHLPDADASVFEHTLQGVQNDTSLN